METRRLSSGGVELSYYDGGSGRPLLLVHSFGHNKLMWFPQLFHFIRQGFRVIAPDLPGHGESSFDPARHTMDSMAAAYTGLMDQLDLRETILVGISMGGFVTLRMWAIQSERIAAMVLSNTKAEADSEDLRKVRMAQIEQLRQRGLGAWIEEGAPKRLSARTLDQKPWVLDLVRLMNFTIPAEAVAATLQAMATKPDDTETLSTIDVPTLVTAGQDDALIPLASAERLQRGIAGSELIILPDTGHLSNLEDPLAFNSALETFLTSRSLLTME